MNKCYIDSNVLIYFKDESSEFNKKTVQKLDLLIEKDFRLVISPLVLDEFLYVFRYGLSRQKGVDLFGQLRKALRDILTLPNLCIVPIPSETDLHLEVIVFMEKYGLNPRDAYHLLTIKQHNVDYFATFDNDFNRVFKDKVLKEI